MCEQDLCSAKTATINSVYLLDIITYFLLCVCNQFNLWFG